MMRDIPRLESGGRMRRGLWKIGKEPDWKEKYGHDFWESE
jgi:hypothetical protein